MYRDPLMGPIAEIARASGSRYMARLRATGADLGTGYRSSVNLKLRSDRHNNKVQNNTHVCVFVLRCPDRD